MAGSPDWKIYNEHGVYRGCMKDPTEAAAVVALYGAGATIRFGHPKKHTCWTEGADGNACDSYDHVAETCWKALADILV